MKLHFLTAQRKPAHLATYELPSMDATLQ